MPTQIAKTAHAIGTDLLPQAQAKGRAIAADALPRIADAAHRAGEFIARKSTAASEYADKQLRAIQPDAAERSVKALGSALSPALLFVRRRPVLSLVAGALAVRAGVGLWRHFRARPAQPEPTPS